MASTLDDVTINYEENGVLVVKELDKQILSKGVWGTVIYRYQQWEPKKQGYSSDRYTIRRYRKINDDYRQQSKFNISSPDQAKKISDILTQWISEIEE